MLMFINVFFYGIGGNRADVSPDVKLLVRPMDTRDTKSITSALPDFGGWGGRGKGVGEWASLTSHTLWNTAQALFHTLSVRPWFTPLEPANSFRNMRLIFIIVLQKWVLNELLDLILNNLSLCNHFTSNDTQSYCFIITTNLCSITVLYKFYWNIKILRVLL